MNVAELIERAHVTARAKGFWDGPRENVAEKLALIATEVAEFQEATTPEEALEEIADVVIRTFDLAGYLGHTFKPECLSGHPPFADSKRKFVHGLHFCTAKATQANRSGKRTREYGNLSAIVYLCADYTRRLYGPGRLEEAILRKMEKNESRPRLHGKLY